jgi:hypothetical protein
VRLEGIDEGSLVDKARSFSLFHSQRGRLTSLTLCVPLFKWEEVVVARFRRQKVVIRL